MPEFSLEILLILSAVALLAGFIDAIAGGGGLLTIPALMLVGINPVQAIATNKLQACFGSFTATRFFIKQGLVKPKENWLSIIVVGIGAAAGAILIQWFDTDLLLVVMPYALIVIAFYLLFARNFGKSSGEPKISSTAFNSTAIPAVGVYDGFFGPGTGTFFTLGYCQLRGMNMLEATAHAKLMNFTTNIVSLLVFILSGQILWVVGLSMAVGQAIGARLGAATALKHGVGFIRLMTVAICVAISVSLLVRG